MHIKTKYLENQSSNMLDFAVFKEIHNNFIIEEIKNVTSSSTGNPDIHVIGKVAACEILWFKCKAFEEKSFNAIRQLFHGSYLE